MSDCDGCKYCGGKNSYHIYLKYCLKCETWTPKWHKGKVMRSKGEVK